MGTISTCIGLPQPIWGYCCWQMWACLLVIYPQGLRSLKVGGPREPAQGIGSTLRSHLVNIQKGGSIKWRGDSNRQHDCLNWNMGQLCIFFIDCVKLECNIVKNIPSFLFPNCFFFFFFLQWQLSVLMLWNEMKHKYSLERSQHGKSHSTAQPGVILKLCCPLLEQMWNYNWCSSGW